MGEKRQRLRARIEKKRQTRGRVSIKTRHPRRKIKLWQKREGLLDCFLSFVSFEFERLPPPPMLLIQMIPSSETAKRACFIYSEHHIDCQKRGRFEGPPTVMILTHTHTKTQTPPLHPLHLRASVHEPLIVHPLIAQELRHVVSDRVGKDHDAALALPHPEALGLRDGRVRRRP